jgi:hypothetical protein
VEAGQSQRAIRFEVQRVLALPKTQTKDIS